MSLQNVRSLLDTYRAKNVTAVRTPSGIVWMGMGQISPDERNALLKIPQDELQKVLRWQR